LLIRCARGCIHCAAVCVPQLLFDHADAPCCAKSQAAMASLLARAQCRWTEMSAMKLLDKALASVEMLTPAGLTSPGAGASTPAAVRKSAPSPSAPMAFECLKASRTK